MDEDQCSNRIIGAAIEVHRILGPGLLESAYEAALTYQLPDAYRMDLLVENLAVVEVKAVEKFSALHSAQLMTYLKFSRKNLGLLLNFNTIVMKDGIKRMVSGAVTSS